MKPDIEKIVETTKYYQDKLNDSQLFNIPNHPKIHHYILLVAVSVLETRFNTYFVLPISAIFMTHLMVIRQEFNTRVLAQCVSEELEILHTNPDANLTNNEREIIFYDISGMVSDTGFKYTRSLLLIRSFILAFLIYYATIGLVS